MALPPPDMNDCCPKRKCLSGVNAGLLYSTCEPCAKGSLFDPDECDCYAPTAWKRINAFWSIRRVGVSGIYENEDSFVIPGWYNGSLKTSLYGGYDSFVYLNAGYFSSSTACNGRFWEQGGSQNGVFQYSYWVSASPDGLTGEGQVLRAACVWPEDCYAIRYGSNRPDGCLSFIVTGYIVGTKLEYDEETDRFVEVAYKLYDDLDRADPAYPEWRHEQIDALTPWDGPEAAVGNKGMNTNCDCLAYD